MVLENNDNEKDCYSQQSRVPPWFIPFVHTYSSMKKKILITPQTGCHDAPERHNGFHPQRLRQQGRNPHSGTVAGDEQEAAGFV